MKTGRVISWSPKAVATIRHGALLTSAVILFTLIFGSPAISQDDEAGAPPPLKLVPKAEGAQLSDQADLKNRTKMALVFMDGHLLAAEKLATTGDAVGTFRELGSFEALMDESLAFLQKNDIGSNKSLDSFRKLEIGLREFMPRLETVRRGLPLDCDEYVRKLMHDLREARAKAVDPFFSDNVVRVKDDR